MPEEKWIRKGGDWTQLWWNVIDDPSSADSPRLTAEVRVDGCIHLRRFFNGIAPSAEDADDNSDYIHICDLEEFIEKLKELAALTRAHRSD